MKTLRIALLTTLFLTTVSLSVSAQKMSRKEIAAIEKAEQARLNTVRHAKALAALESSQWAFESTHLTDANGRIITTANPQPNVFSFDGVRFYGTFLLTTNVGIVESNGKVISHSINKKGEAIYRFESVAPTRSECTITLDTNTPNATLYISTDQGTATYQGEVMPITECRFVMKVQYGRGN